MTITWEEIKSRISSVLPRNTFALWIEPITCLEHKNKTMILACPNKFSCNWVVENYLGLIEQQCTNAGARCLELVFKVQPPKKERAVPPNTQTLSQLPLPNLKHNPGQPLYFNHNFTFDRFIVGRSNEFAYSASKALARGGRWDYHTLLMLANTGLGKTHLSQAAGHAVLEENPKTRVYYITAEQFTNEMIYALKNNRIEAFKDKYRRCCDFLLLDEIHFLSGKHKTQIELGYTLDALTNDNKKIIFTSSLPPKDLPNISRELSSRLTSGLVTTIDKPDYDTRVQILTRKASEQKLSLSKEIIHLLARSLKRDVRQMESALHYLKAKSELLKAKISLDLAKDVLRCLVSRDCSVSMEDIRNLISTYYKVDPEMLRSKSRKKIYSYPRNIYAYLCRRHTDETVENIAATINRSHSAVVYASEMVEHKMETDEKMRRQLTFLNQRLTAS